MRRLTVRDVMTTHVITASLTTPFKEIAGLLSEHHVSALPVLGERDELVGVVSEADLLLKQGHRRHSPRSGWLSAPHLREVLAKVEGDLAGDLMTAPAVTIGPDASVVEAARLMAAKRVKRLPVVDDDTGTLIGIVSRADLVAVFLRSDDDIRDEINHEVFRRVLLTAPGKVRVDVDDGVVRLDGVIDRKSSAEIAERLTWGIDGVVDVVNELAYEWDDSESRTARFLGSI